MKTYYNKIKTKKIVLPDILQNICLSFCSVLLIAGFGCQTRQAPVMLSIDQYQTPVLINKEYNPLVRICLYVTDSLKSVSVNIITITSKGTSLLDDLETVRMYYTGKDSALTVVNRFGESMSPDTVMNFTGNQTLSPGTNYFWVSYKLKPNADLLHRVDAGCREILLSSGISLKPDVPSPPGSQRIGIALRKHGDDDVDTYRIPGLTTTKSGTLLAIYDVRRERSRDLQGDIDIGLSRSMDGGQTWEPMQIVLDMDSWGGLPEKYNGVGDACILADEVTGNVFVAGLWMYGVLDKNGQWIEGLTNTSTAWNHQWRDKGSQPGFDVKHTSQFLLTESSDDGKTWKKQKNLTKMLKKYNWWLFAPAPGRGITMEDGTLVFPTQGRDAEGLPFSNITYSKDHGKTWHISNPAATNTTESAVVQLSNGSLMLNMRDNRNRKTKGENNGRAIAVTMDMGASWTEHPTSHKALKEPVCMASLIKAEYAVHGHEKSILFFSNPNHQYKRQHLTIKASFDDGMTWPEKYWLLLDEGRGRGYSCLTQINDTILGILYESSQADLVFEKININEIIK